MGRKRYLESLRQLLGFDPESKKTILITTHRRENLNGKIDSIFEAISALATEYPDARFVLPLHPNPTIVEAANLKLANHSNVKITKPLNYSSFVTLLSSCHFVLTDSGGVQEEAVTLGVKAFVLRESTERPEGLGSGNLELIGTSVDSIVQAARTELDKEVFPRDFEVASNVFGDGQASKRIHSVLSGALFGT